MKKRKKLKKEIAAIIIPFVILGGVVLAVFLKNFELNKKMVSEEIKSLDLGTKLLDFYSEQEAKLLEDEGFLTANVADKINEKITENATQNATENAAENKEPENQEEITKEEIAKILKPLTLVEQTFGSSEEGFEVLATQLDVNNNVYKMAFKLENRSSEQKNFFLIPVFHQSQVVFKGIRGLITDVSDAQALSFGVGAEGLQLLTKLYDVNQHKSELKPELAQAYLDIEQNNYQVNPIEVAILPKSTVVAQSEWEVLAEGESQEQDLFESVYLLVYGSAGGARDEVTILNIGSYPEQDGSWVVDFFTRAIADLYIVPIAQATIDDEEFVSLSCGNSLVQPQILEGDIIYYPEWSCFDISRIVHSTKKEGNHALRFVFGNEDKYAFNKPNIGIQFSGPNSAGDLAVGGDNQDEILEESAENPVEAGPRPAEESPVDDGTLPPEPETPGCTDSQALNYKPAATANDGSCIYPEPPHQSSPDDSDGAGQAEIEGCIDADAENFNPEATIDDGSCLYAEPPAPETPPAEETDSPATDGTL